jgi:putative spermidine/putrescine transport system permease protein
LTVPAIALVVGLKPLYIWININVTPSVLALAFAYLVLVLPYSYRALDAGLAAIDLKTLSEAARSLGAGWGTVMLRIVIPNMPSAILNASLLSVALVLGEYTVANLLNFQNLQVEIAYVGLTDANTSTAVAVGALILAFILLMVLTLVGGRLQQQHYIPGQRA